MAALDDVCYHGEEFGLIPRLKPDAGAFRLMDRIRKTRRDTVPSDLASLALEIAFLAF